MMSTRTKGPVDICYYSSDFYAPYTGISMYSICKNNQDLDFRITCIDTGISEENKEKMRQAVTSFGKELVFYSFAEMERMIRDDLKLPLCSGSYATYIKVFPDRIFKDCDRILFMDGDTIIRGSIKPLLEMDLDPYVFAATKVSLINEKWVYEENRPDNLRLQYSLKFKDIGYYNIGIFYVNLKRWAEVDFGAQIMAMKDLHLDTITKAPDVPVDEMLINLAALEHLDEHYVCPVPAIYNSTVHQIPHYRGLRSNLCCGYIEKEAFDQAYYHPVIIHYCIFKPWYVDTFSPYRKVLNKYIAQSPWPDAFTDHLYKTIPEKFFGKFVYSMPSEPLMMFTIQMGHFYLRTKGKLRNKCIEFCRFVKAKTDKWKNRERPVREKKEKQPKQPRAHSHFVQAVMRRGRCLLDGDIRMAFAWPSEYLAERKGKM